MISSKAMGYMLIMGLVGFAVMFFSFFMQGNQEGSTGVVEWAAASKDWENVGMVRMLALFSNLIFDLSWYIFQPLRPKILGMDYLYYLKWPIEVR